MSQASLSRIRPRPHDRSDVMWFVMFGLALVVGISLLAVRMSSSGSPASNSVSVPTSAAIEAKYGIRVTQIAATADNGLVDFRFVAIDPDKALNLLNNVKKLPILVEENNHTIINSASLMGHKHSLNPGETYFVLYRDTNGAIKEGSPVTVAFPDLRLEHVIAK